MALSFSDTFHSNILRQLVLGEGERFVAYRCTAGKLTIDVGHNCDAKPVPGVTKVGDSITTGQSRQFFIEDITTAIQEVQKAFPWVVLLNEPRQAVLYDMAFNVGIGGLKTFKNTMKLIEGGQYELACTNIMKSKYARDVASDGPGGRYDRPLPDSIANPLRLQWESLSRGRGGEDATACRVVDGAAHP